MDHFQFQFFFHKSWGVFLTFKIKMTIVYLGCILLAKRAIPSHYNDYDVFKSKLEDFQIQIRKAGLEDRIHYLMHGETYNFEVGTDNDSHNI